MAFDYDFQTQTPPPGSAVLKLGDQVIWHNPPELGFFGVKLRKQLREEQIAWRILREDALDWYLKQTMDWEG